MKTTAGSALLIAFVVFAPGLARAAHLLHIDSNWTSNSKSNGIVIAAQIGFPPGESSAQIEVRAYELIGDDNQQFRPIRARSCQHGDSAGNYVNRTTVLRTRRAVRVRRGVFGLRRRQSWVFPNMADTEFVNHRVTVLDSQLKLSPGIHTIALEVRGIVGNRVEFIEPLGVESIFVETLKEKRTFTEQYSVAHMVPEKHVGQVPFVADGKLQSTMAEYSVTKPVYETKTREFLYGPGELYRHTKEEVQPSGPTSAFKEEQQRIVYFATNRNRVDKTASDEMYGDELAKLSFGMCAVNIPLTSYHGGAATTTSFNWWARRYPDKYFFVDSVNVLGADAFRDALSNDDVLVFVHGYSNSFKDSLIATAKLQHDIRFPGKMVAFSWPSEGSALGYVAADPLGPWLHIGYFDDAYKAAKSGAALAAGLQQLIDAQRRRGVGKIHVVAHSMGNRVMLDAMRRLDTSVQNGRALRPFGHIVLASADVVGEDFARDIESAKALSRGVTFYHSNKDWALTVSRYVNVDKPVGRSAIFSRGMDTVDATNGTSFWRDNFGHSYWACSRYMYFDLHLLIARNQSPRHRIPPLGGPEMIAKWEHWFFTPGQSLLSPWWRKIPEEEPVATEPSPAPPAPPAPSAG